MRKGCVPKSGITYFTHCYRDALKTLSARIGYVLTFLLLKLVTYSYMNVKNSQNVNKQLFM